MSRTSRPPRPLSRTLILAAGLALALAGCGAAQDAPPEQSPTTTTAEAAAETSEGATADPSEDAEASSAGASDAGASDTEASPGEASDDAASAPEDPADADGRWCPAPDGEPGWGCVTVAYPQVTIEETGESFEIEHVGEDGECLVLSAADAPFGSYCPAGTELPLPDYYPGADRPDADRIWNGQTAVLLLRA